MQLRPPMFTSSVYFRLQGGLYGSQHRLRFHIGNYFSQRDIISTDWLWEEAKSYIYSTIQHFGSQWNVSSDIWSYEPLQKQKYKPTTENIYAPPTLTLSDICCGAIRQIVGILELSWLDYWGFVIDILILNYMNHSYQFMVTRWPFVWGHCQKKMLKTCAREDYYSCLVFFYLFLCVDKTLPVSPCPLSERFLPTFLSFLGPAISVACTVTNGSERELHMASKRMSHPVFPISVQLWTLKAAFPHKENIHLFCPLQLQSCEALIKKLWVSFPICKQI